MGRGRREESTLPVNTKMANEIRIQVPIAFDHLAVRPKACDLSNFREERK